MNTQNTKEFANKRVLLMVQRGWGLRTGHMLAQRLTELGCVLGGVVFKRTTMDFVKKQNNVVYDYLTTYEEVVEDPKAYLAGDNYTLEEICDDLNIDSVWPYVQSMREHVKSYRDKFYYGYKQDKPDEEIILLVKAVYKNVKTTFETFKPDVIITPNFVTMLQLFYSLYAKKQGLKMLRVTDSRVSGVCIVVHDHHEDGGRFFDRIKELNAGAVSQNVGKAREYIKLNTERLIQPLYADEPFQPKSFIKKVREFISPFYKSAKFYFQPHPNRLKNIPVMVDYMPPKYLIRDYFVYRRNKRLTDNYAYDSLESVDKIIYFPLQFQPEETIDVLAPKFNNQLEVVRQVAMAAPGDYTVVVKEHPTMAGLRSISYMEKLQRIPNVKMIDYRTPSESVIKKSDLVVSLSGTTLSEAAFCKKPAIQFGTLATTKQLPNVFLHTDFVTLSGKIKELLNKNFNTAEYDQQLLNFVSAAYDVGKDVDYIGIWRGLTKEGMDTLWHLYSEELKEIFNN